MQLQLQVGPQQPSDGTFPTIRGGKGGDVIVSELQARYYENSYRKNVFFGANTAVQALSVANATYTGLVVANPSSSTVNLVLLEITCASATAPATFSEVVLGYAPTVALTTGNSTGPTGLSNIVGGTTKSSANVGAGCTFGAAPTIMRALGSAGVSGTAASAWFTAGIKDDVGGLVIVPPGQAICIEAVTTAISVVAGMVWSEVNI